MDYIKLGKTGLEVGIDGLALSTLNHGTACLMSAACLRLIEEEAYRSQLAQGPWPPGS